MKSEAKTGTLILPTQTAIALWKRELVGQLGDGMWENARPQDHWTFWADMEVTLGVPAVETTVAWQCRKNSYNFAALYPIVGDRMLEIGREVDPSYDMKAMRADVKAIKAAMKTVAIRQ